MTDPGAPRRILVIGEALVDVVERPDGTHSAHVGGSPANVAVGLGRLGRHVDLMTWIGNDDFGDLIVRRLNESSVSLVKGSRHSGSTSTALAILDDQGAAAYTFDIAWDLGPAEAAPEPIVVHMGSIACVLEPGATRVMEELDRMATLATITYDPNIRPELMGDREDARTHIESVVGKSDIVKVSIEDLAWLYPTRESRDVAAEWLTHGPAVVFVTLGSEGSFGVAARSYAEFRAPVVTVVDTVGAGDAFMAGIIDAMAFEDLLGIDVRRELHDIDADTLQRVGDYASLVARLTVAKAGAEPPTRAEVLAAG